MNYQLVFRSPFGQVTAVAMAVVAVIFMGLIWRADGFLPMLASAPLPIGLAYFSWWIWGWPAVMIDSRGVLVRNQLRTYRISWNAFTKAESRFGLYIYVNNGEGEGANPSTRNANVAPSTTRLPSSTEPSAPAANTTATAPNQSAASPAAARPDLPTVRGELTIGDVDPITLDPDGLALRKPIYAAAVPARGGLRTAARKEMPEIPTLDLRARNRVVLRVPPMVAARILDEEKYYLDHPTERPESHSSKEAFVVGSRALRSRTAARGATGSGATESAADPSGATTSDTNPTSANTSPTASTAYRGLRITSNWLQISGLVAFVAYWVWMLV